MSAFQLFLGALKHVVLLSQRFLKQILPFPARFEGNFSFLMPFLFASCQKFTLKANERSKNQILRQKKRGKIASRQEDGWKGAKVQIGGQIEENAFEGGR